LASQEAAGDGNPQIDFRAVMIEALGRDPFSS
jgi:hypothetical protein